MDPGPLRDLCTLAVGVLTGVLSGAFGVGGAVISTPGIRLLGVPALVAVGTTLPSILPSAVSGSLRYSREEIIDWKAVAFTAPTGIVAAVGGSLLAREVPGEGHALMIFTAVLLMITAARMGRTPRDRPVLEGEDVGPEPPLIEPPEPDGHRSAPAFAAVGLFAGLLSGLLGIGGGVVMVPAFAQWIRLPLKTAIATSLVCVGVFAIPGTITHAVLGNIDWRFALLLAVGVIPGARLGAAAAIRATDERLRVTVAAFLSVIAVVYAVGEIAALVD